MPGVSGDGRSEELASGWEALRAGRWEDARELFARAVDAGGTAEAHEGLSWAAWWLDDAGAMFAAREQAFRLYRERGDAASAARMATWIAADQLDFHGAVAVASGWLDRAFRLLEPLPVGPDHGWLAFHQGYVALVRGETDLAEERGAHAAELGRRFDVVDLQMLGLALNGMILVSRARVREGMRRLDEASAIALSNEASIPISSAWTCCFLVTACTRVLDFERAFEWCDRIAEFADRYGSKYMLGFCRAEYALIHTWRGEWEAAERALEESIAALSAARAPMAGGSLAQLAELRRRQGRADECVALLDEAGASPSAQICRAELALDAGDPRRALDLAESMLRARRRDRPVDAVPALDVAIRAHLACAELDGASAAADELADVASEIGTTALVAKASLARAMVAAARADHAAAKPLAEDAIDGFERCRARFEAARARIVVASTLLALGRPRDAAREATAASDCLRELGATVDAERARALLSRCEPREDEMPAIVSRRERDVLGLLAEGLTNREISKRLHISEHTVHRHVTNILRKLGVSSRAAAAAWGVRAGLVTMDSE